MFFLLLLKLILSFQFEIMVMHLLFLLLLIFPFQSFAQENPIEEVVVYGVRPGPELWKVTKGENVLWVLGTLSPLPKKMKWHSEIVESVIQNSQALLLQPGFSVSADIGFFGKISLASSAIGIKKNSDKQKLNDVLPKDVYARWLVLKKQYLGRDRGVEKLRPIFASKKLYEKAINKMGLTSDTKVSKKVKKIAKKNKLTSIRPYVKIKLENPKKTLKEFKKSNVNDSECFSKTLNRVEKDLISMRNRANAWANGDVQLLRELKFPTQDAECSSAILNSSVAQGVGFENLSARMQKTWLEAAKKALDENKSTFALLHISNLLGENSYLDILKEQGYTVHVPK